MTPLLRISNYLYKALDLLTTIANEMTQLRLNQELILAAVNGAPANNNLLRAKEVAILLNVEERTIRNWKKSGRLVPVKVGMHDYYPESLVRKYKS